MNVKSLVSGWTVIKEVTISALPRRVFKALTNPHELNVWFTHGSKVNLKIGGRYSNLDGDKGRFLEVVPAERLRFTWDNSQYGRGSIVEVFLKKIRNQTVLTLVHSGFKRRTDFEDYASDKEAWVWALSNLKAHLEGRHVMSYEEWLKRTRA